MEISYLDLKQREIVNTYDGKRLGHIVDIVFDDTAGYVLGFVVPSINKHIFKKTEDIFVPISCISKMGSDVILVKLEPSANAQVFAKGGKAGVYDYFAYQEKTNKQS